jgi:predicted lipoprotein
MNASEGRPLGGRRRALVTIGAAIGGACGFGCGPTPIADRRRELLRSWCEDFLLVRYAEFVERTDELFAAAVPLADEPIAERLAAAKKAWWTARKPFKEVEVFAFGPAIEEPLRYGPKIDFWPVRSADVEAVLADTAPIDASRLGANSKGMPAIEYLLFAPDALAQFRSTPRRGQALVAFASDLALQARGLRDAWSPEGGDFQSELVEAGVRSSTFDTLPMALSEVVNRMAFTIEAIRGNKLEAGIASDGRPLPDRLESQFSGRSIADIRDNLRGIELLFFGAEAQGISGLDALLQRRGHYLANSVRGALREARAQLATLDPLTRAVSEDVQGVHVAAERLGVLQRIIQVDVLGALSLSVRFSDNDGD